MIVRDALLRAAQHLERAGLDTHEARREARLLLARAAGRDLSWVLAFDDQHLAGAVLDRFQHWVRRRTDGEPVAYILGEREFWGLTLSVTPDTLIPRPETEHLVEWALEAGPSGPARVLDLGTGTGAIACALASERPMWQVTAVDVSPAALDVARQNVARLGLANVQCLLSDWFSGLQPEQRWDLIVSNPPYIEAGDRHLEQGDVRFEPAGALASGADGLDAIRHLIQQAPGFLVPGGHLLVEHGWNQGEAVRRLFGGEWTDVETRRDLAGHERLTGARLRGAEDAGT
ncbi:peptide chain release factor N(5)-glutamine methyltransferase [Hahella sp. SMD15-11]|uniref:Release factor glutamine methyltransferase n=1 Tax=Thermohahella caldifontis TaxID=3142973 RepID=A0AB39UWT1_9GAMM